VLVDRTDNLTPPQNNALQTFIQEVSLDQNALVDLPRYGRMSLYSFETSAATQPQLDLLFSYCKPPAKNDANELYETPALLQREFEATFGRELLARTQKLTEPNTSPQSFIITSITLALSEHQYDGTSPSRTMIVFSDMMEHTPIYSHYRGNRNTRFSAEEVMTRYPELFADIDLRDVEVKLIYLPRNNARRIQGIQHQRFWRDLFTQLGAESVIIQRGPE